MFTNQKLRSENGNDGSDEDKTNRKLSFVFPYYSLKQYDDAMNNAYKYRAERGNNQNRNWITLLLKRKLIPMEWSNQRRNTAA